MVKRSVKNEQAIAGAKSQHSFHERLKDAFQLKQKPWWFDLLMSEILTAIEPRARDFYQECKRLGHPGPYTAREFYDRRTYDPWNNQADRDFMLGYSRIADGEPFVSAPEEMAKWRAKQPKPADITPSDDRTAGLRSHAGKTQI